MSRGLHSESSKESATLVMNMPHNSLHVVGRIGWQHVRHPIIAVVDL